MQEYRVKLNEFEGPMELLLELCEKEKLNISEISLASVCDQFLEYSKHFEELEPKYLANFLVIAARLILIKSKSLLPFLELTEDEEEDIDELKQKLEEFQKIKRGADFIKKLEQKKLIAYHKTPGFRDVKVFLPPKDITKEKLSEFFRHLKQESEKEEVKEKLQEKKIEVIISFEEKISEIKNRLVSSGKDYFKNVSDKKSKINTIIAFLAVLELIKQDFLSANQEGNFNEIALEKI